MERGKAHCKPVISTDAEGNKTYFPSLKAAAEAVGAKTPEISMACASGYKCRGLYWCKEEQTPQPLTRRQASVVLAFAHNGMRYTPTCEALYLHENTVRYNLDKAHEKTGKDPRDFFELYELVKIARKVLEDEN